MKERLLSEIHGYLLNEDGLYGNKKGQRLGQRLRENTDRLQSDLGFALVVQIVGIVIFATLWVLR